MVTKARTTLTACPPDKQLAMRRRASSMMPCEYSSLSLPSSSTRVRLYPEVGCRRRSNSTSDLASSFRRSARTSAESSSTSSCSASPTTSAATVSASAASKRSRNPWGNLWVAEELLPFFSFAARRHPSSGEPRSPPTHGADSHSRHFLNS